MSKTQNINWDTAPAVPVQVLQMINRGAVPAGRVIDGPMGQKTYVGPIRERSAAVGDWRDDLKNTPDR